MVVLVMDFQTVDIFVHALMVTAEWTAKTVILKGYMNKLNPEEQIQKSINFSSATSPNMFQVFY